MVSDSEGDDFEDPSEFGVDEAEIFGMGTSGCRKSPMSKLMGFDSEPGKCPNFDSVYRFCFGPNVILFPCVPVPENTENEGDALLHFTAEFSAR